MNKVYPVLCTLALSTVLIPVFAGSPVGFDVSLSGEYVLFAQGTDLAVTIDKVDITCAGASNGELEANPNGGTAPYTYAWSNNGDTKSINQLAPGEYTVTVTDNADCTITATTTITEPPPITGAIEKLNDVQCNGGSDGSAVIDPSGGTGNYVFAWSHSGAATTAMVGNLSAGMAMVTVTDANGCTLTDAVSISQPDALMLAAAVAHESANDAMDGSIAATVMGGTGPYTYAWSNGGNTATIMNLPPGSYTLDVTDANGCQIQGTYVVDEFGCMISASASTQDVACAGDATGQAVVNIENGTDPVTIAWSNGANGAMIDNLAAGNYQYTITDGANCSLSDSVVISQPEMLTIIIDTVIGDLGGGTGEVQITVSGGTAPYSYAWSDGNIAEDLVGALSGTYNVTVTDAENCVVESDSVEVLMVVDILETSLGGTVEVFPNPASRYVTIRPRANIVLGDQIELFEISGQSVVERQIENNQIPVYDLPAGLYLMKLQVEQKYYFTRLLVLRE